MRNKLGSALMALGTVLVLAALSLFLWNQREANRAAQAVEEILPQLIAQVDACAVPADPTQATEEAPADRDMTVVEIDGYGYIGCLSIPVLGLELPVMSEWDYTRLRVAPCRFAGSIFTDDLVIAAHNYTRHFGNLKTLSEGDVVCFTDMDGVVFTYEVITIEILPPTAIEEMTAGEYALTLFTCTYGGRSRATVRCVRTE